MVSQRPSITSRAVARRVARRGMTLMEVVAAIAILAILSSVVFAALSSVISAQTRQQQRLGSAELANRLILMYLDDPDSMPDPALTIVYNGDQYRWAKDTQPVLLEAARAETGASIQERSRVSLDRMDALTIRVWLSEKSGGSLVPSDMAPAFAITRVVDPIATLTRNADSMQNMLNSERGRQRLMAPLQGADRGGFARSGNRRADQGVDPGRAGAGAGSGAGGGLGASPTGGAGKGGGGKGDSGKGAAPKGGRAGDGRGGLGSGGPSPGPKGKGT